jgi:hypothetical protein
MWTMIEVSAGTSLHKGRFRMEGDQVVLEWRGGRVAERCGLLKPEFVATVRLRQLVSQEPMAA